MKLPKWKCHKIVEAAEVEAIKPYEDGQWFLSLAVGDGEIEPHLVSREFMQKHKPRVGGYFVRYEDGYESFSPPEAFESGYARIEEEGQAS